jgi:DNA-binding beta-propeller fold protein YncE
VRHWIFPLVAAGLVIAGCSQETVGPETSPEASSDATIEGSRSAGSGYAVIANRGSGTISVIDGRTFQVTGTYHLPAEAGEPQPEPMYVVYTPRHHRIFVGDRANDRVAVFDAQTFQVEGTVAAGHGVFHMWADGRERQLWVNNDIDNTSTVVDLSTLSVMTTVPTPSDLVAMGGKPHDVVLGQLGERAYVTVLAVSGENDYVVQFDTGSFSETARAAVGKDPHVSLARQRPWLYVPCQESDQVIVLDRRTLELETVLDIPGAHGAGMSDDGRTFYTTNLPGGGMNALYTISTGTNEILGAPVDSPYPVPHNIALSPDAGTLFLTHSGATSDKVTVYRMSGGDRIPEYAAEVTVGLNPFGLTYVP